ERVDNYRIVRCGVFVRATVHWHHGHASTCHGFDRGPAEGLVVGKIDEHIAVAKKCSHTRSQQHAMVLELEPRLQAPEMLVVRRAAKKMEHQLSGAPAGQS